MTIKLEDNKLYVESVNAARQEMKANPKWKDMIDYLSKRERGRTFFYINSSYNIMKRERIADKSMFKDWAPTDVEGFFKRLDKIRAGTVDVDPKEGPTFYFYFHSKEWCNHVLGKDAKGFEAIRALKAEAPRSPSRTVDRRPPSDSPAPTAASSTPIKPQVQDNVDNVMLRLAVKEFFNLIDFKALDPRSQSKLGEILILLNRTP